MAEKAVRLGKDSRANSATKPNCVDIPQITGWNYIILFNQ